MHAYSEVYIPPNLNTLCKEIFHHPFRDIAECWMAKYFEWNLHKHVTNYTISASNKQMKNILAKGLIKLLDGRMIIHRLR